MTAVGAVKGGQPAPDAVRIALVYPDLLGTYGDGGNATVLAQRLRWRGRAAEVVTIHAGEAVPAQCDLYVVGGGEDLPQALATRQLGRPGPLHQAVEGGAVVLAVCAGLQILGTSFVGPDGVETDGLGLLDCRTVRGPEPRAVGELVVDPDPASGLPPLTGYENHGGATLLGPSARPAGTVRTGFGNRDGASTDGVSTDGVSTDGVSTDGVSTDGVSTDGVSTDGVSTDGVWAGRIWGTYLHGPALARNPALADLLLGWVVGDLAPLDDAEVDELRAARFAAAAAEAAPAARRRRLRSRA